MSRSARSRAAAPSPHRLDPLLTVLGRMCPDLSADARRRIAEMAMAMRDAAVSDESCTRSHMIAAGFGLSEIEGAGIVAQAALRELDAAVPDEAVEPWSVTDTAALRRFAKRQAAADYLAAA